MSERQDPVHETPQDESSQSESIQTDSQGSGPSYQPQPPAATEDHSESGRTELSGTGSGSESSLQTSNISFGASTSSSEILRTPVTTSGAQYVYLYKGQNVVENAVVVDYNQRIRDCIEKVDMQRAVQLFEEIQEQGYSPSAYTYTVLMKGFSKTRNSSEALRYFDDMKQRGIVPEVVAFNVAIGCCGQLGEVKKAEEVVEEMKTTYSLDPNLHTYVALMKLYAKVKALDKMKEMLDAMVTTGIQPSVKIFNILIGAYASTRDWRNLCMAIDVAKEMREEWELDPDNGTYTALQEGFKDGGNLRRLLGRIEDWKWVPNEIELTVAMRAAAANQDLRQLSELRNKVEKCGFPMTVHTYIPTMTYFLRRKQFLRVMDVFGEMRGKGLEMNSEVFRLVFRSCKAASDWNRVLMAFAEAKAGGMRADEAIYHCLIRALSKTDQLETILEQFAEMKNDGIKRTDYIFNMVIDCCVLCGDIVRAEEVFAEMKGEGVTVDAVTYNTLLKGFAKVGDTEKGLDVLATMVKEGVEPDSYTYGAIGALCRVNGDIEAARDKYQRLLSIGLDPDSVFHHLLMKEFSKPGQMRQLGRYLARASMPDSFVLELMVGVKASRGELSEAKRLLEEMKATHDMKPGVVASNALMKGLLEAESAAEVFSFFEQMKQEGWEINTATINSVIRACALTRDLEQALALFSSIHQEHALLPDAFTYRSMIHVCAKSRALNMAQAFFSEMVQAGIKPTDITYNTLIDAYAETATKQNGVQHVNKCEELVKEMKATKMNFGRRTYNMLLKVCARGSLMSKVPNIISEMDRNEIRPDVITYNIILDGLAKDSSMRKERKLQCLQSLIDHIQKAEIRLDENDLTFNSLLNLCADMGELERAERCFREMKKRMEPDAVTYGTMMKCYEKIGDQSDKERYIKPFFELYQEIIRRGLQVPSECYTYMLSACGNVQDLQRADFVWRRMKERRDRPDVYNYNAMLKAYTSSGNYAEAVRLMDEMEETGVRPDEVTFTTMFSFIASTGKMHDTVEMMRRLNRSRVRPTGRLLGILRRLNLI